jgi:hypothetical protein
LILFRWNEGFPVVFEKEYKCRLSEKSDQESKLWLQMSHQNDYPAAADLKNFWRRVKWRNERISSCWWGLKLRSRYPIKNHLFHSAWKKCNYHHYHHAQHQRPSETIFECINLSSSKDNLKPLSLIVSDRLFPHSEILNSRVNSSNLIIISAKENK